MSYENDAVDENYVESRLVEALAFRRKLAEEGRLELTNDSAYRLVHELGDGLTGLAIDIYGR